MSPANTTPRRAKLSSKTRGTPYLEVISGSQRGRRVELTQAQTVLGREDAAVCFDDSGVSRRHAKLILAADQSVMVMDLGSTNQTLVNGTNIELATLSAGDRISLGPDVLLRFDYGDAPEEQSDAVADDVLSARQWEVARLVAQGLGNAQVAAKLHISANTVARHLENIYARLGLRSRTALARWVLEHERGAYSKP